MRAPSARRTLLVAEVVAIGVTGALVGLLVAGTVRPGGEPGVRYALRVPDGRTAGGALLLGAGPHRPAA